MRKPFFRKARKCWFVKDDQGRFIRLDPDEKKAFAIWERLRNIADYKHHDASLEAIFEAFLKHQETELSKVRFDLVAGGVCNLVRRDKVGSRGRKDGRDAVDAIGAGFARWSWRLVGSSPEGRRACCKAGSGLGHPTRVPAVV
jgi:hypothetical protein